MGWNSPVLTSPASVKDLSDALGISSGDATVIIPSAGAAGLMNIWAKYKGFNHPAPGYLTDAEVDAVRAIKNCGMTMQEFASLSALINAGVALNIGAAAWIYDYPRGISYGDEWCCVVPDFCSFDGQHGYDLTAKAPFRLEVLPSPSYTLDDAKITDAAGGLTFGNEIQKSDLNGDGSPGRTSGYRYYNLKTGINYGIAFVLNGTVVDAKTFATMPSNVSVPTSVTGTPGTYDVIVFLTDQSFDWGGSAAAGKYYLAPIPRSSWRMYANAGLYVEASFTDSSRSAITFTIKNNSATNRQYVSIGVTANISSATVATSGILNAGATIGPFTFNKAAGDNWPEYQTFTLIFTTSSKQVNINFQATIPI